MLVRFTDVNDAGSPVFIRSENIDVFYASQEADGTTIATKYGAVVVVKETPDQVVSMLKEFTSMDTNKALRVKGECQRLVDHIDGMTHTDDVLKYLHAQTQVALEEANRPNRF